ncbi:thermonuclease family protein, partial [Victivallis vadensis]
AILEKQRLSDLLTNALVIELRNIDRDKYFRIDADVYIDGIDILTKLNPDFLTPKAKGGI